jgi:SpoU rRNA methylase family enzyme
MREQSAKYYAGQQRITRVTAELCAKIGASILDMEDIDQVVDLLLARDALLIEESYKAGYKTGQDDMRITTSERDDLYRLFNNTIRL